MGLSKSKSFRFEMTKSKSHEFSRIILGVVPFIMMGLLYIAYQESDTVVKPVFDSGQDLEANGGMTHKVPNPGNEEKEIYNGSKKTNEMDYTFPWLVVRFAGLVYMSWVASNIVTNWPTTSWKIGNFCRTFNAKKFLTQLICLWNWLHFPGGFHLRCFRPPFRSRDSLWLEQRFVY